MKRKIASRYSKALFDLFPSKEKREDILNVLLPFTQVLKKDCSIMKFFSSPQVRLEEKKTVLYKSLGKDVDPQLYSFFFLLLTKNRFGILSEIVDKYNQLIKDASGIVEGEIVTESSLDRTMKAELIKNLEHHYQKTFILQEKVDPTLLGGGVLRIGTRLFDFSLKDKLHQLKNNLQTTPSYLRK